MRRRWRWLGGAVAVLVAFYSILQLFPSEAECVASGRTVDPTRRHCEGSNGYVQLRGHVLFHSQEALVYAVILGGAAYLIARFWRRRRGLAQ